jgi:hypothetical protein
MTNLATPPSKLHVRNLVRLSITWWRKLKDPEARKLLSKVKRKPGLPDNDEGSVEGSVGGLKGPVLKGFFLAWRTLGDVGESQTNRGT